MDDWGATAGSQSDRLIVAAAVVADALPVALLAARRTSPAALAGRWELPGGKVDPGESPTAALHRELAEELGVVVELAGLVVGPLHGDWPLTMGRRLRVWTARLAAASPPPVCREDHDALAWVDAATYDDLLWVPADLAPVMAVLGIGQPSHE